MRVRLYINRSDCIQPPGLYVGKKKKIRVSDDIWNNGSGGLGHEGWTPIWHAFYDRDKAPPGDPWYSLDINKFATLT